MDFKNVDPKKLPIVINAIGVIVMFIWCTWKRLVSQLDRRCNQRRHFRRDLFHFWQKGEIIP